MPSAKMAAILSRGYELKEMMIRGYADYGDVRIMSLSYKDIQYIPESVFMFFSKTTVSITFNV